MKLRIARTAVSSIAAFAALVGAQAGAIELQVGGGFLAEEAPLPPPPEAERFSADPLYRQDEGLSFTPRSEILLFDATPIHLGSMHLGDLEFTVGLDEYWTNVDRLDAMGFRYDREDTGEMMVGGALLIDEFRISGGLGQTTLFGEPAGMVAAGLSYGALSARVLVGQTSVEQQELAEDIWVLSTDLAPMPWLRLEGDVAVTDAPEQEPEAVGRVGIKLRF